MVTIARVYGESKFLQFLIFRKYANAEWEIFKSILSKLIKDRVDEASSNPFAQFIHDAVTFIFSKFCWKMHSEANNVITVGRTQLDDSIFENCVVLCMNKDFMRLMARKSYINFVKFKSLED